MMSDFSQLIACHRHSKDIKTYALAQYCGLDRSNMYKIINGKRKPSSRELVLKICKFMQLSHAEQKEMEQAYEITLIGHDTYYRRKAVVDFFNNFRLSKLNLPVLSELNPEGYFFPAPDGLTYHIFTIRKTFRDILWNSGISYGGRNVGPRLNDLRNTFAVHSPQKLLEEGKRTAEVLPI